MDNVDEIIEEWRDIPGYEGYYQVSNLGRVKSLRRLVVTSNGKKYYRDGVLLVQSIMNHYLSVNLNKDGESKSRRVHRLVGLAFIPNPANKPQIDHIDGNKLNNTYINLRWVTEKENCNNPVTLVKHMGKNNHFYGKAHTEEARRRIREAQPDWSDGNNPAARAVIHGATGEIYDTVILAAKAHGVCQTTMRNILHGTTMYKNDGTWRYLDENK